jgi:hypothetical protein
MKRAFYPSWREDATMVRTLKTRWCWLLAVAVLTTMWACSGTGRQTGMPAVAGSHQKAYPSPAAAAQDLIDTLATGNHDAIRAVLGPDADQLSSGDPVADAHDREKFVTAARSHYRIYEADDDVAYMEVGPKDWRLPIPIVKANDGWRFDTQAGVEIFEDLRIGRNELHTIATLRACVDAQHEYAARNPTGGPVPQFAQRFRSSAGQKNGLYWPVAPGEPESPLGPLMAQAGEEGYFKTRSGEPVPYHGYIYRILTAQGADVPGGALSYIVNGRLTRGFGLLAYPAAYGKSGIMTFVVNQRGIVYQKDLGQNTPTLAAKITAYDPDGSWTPVTEPVL